MSGGYVSVPNAIMRDQTMTPGTRVLFGVILSYAWESGGGRCIVSKDDLAKQAGISVSTFWASIKTLRERGLIEVVQTPHPRGVVNEYRPVTSPVRISDTSPSDMSDHRTRHVQPSDTEEDEEKKTNVVVERERPDKLAEVLDALQNAGFDRLTLEQHYTGLSLVLAECKPPADTDWPCVGVRIEHGLRTGKIKARRPDAALKFVLRSLDGVPRIGQPSQHLFGDRPLTATQQRAAWGAAYARGAAEPPDAEYVVEAEVIEG